MFSKKNKLKSFFSLVLLTSVATIGFQIPTKAEKTALSEVFNSEGFLHQTADTMNKNLPMMVDHSTRWDSTSAGPGKAINYYYTLVTSSANDIDGYLFARNVHGLLSGTVCNNPSTVIFPREGVLLNFNYYDKNRNLIARVQIEPADCGY